MWWQSAHWALRDVDLKVVMASGLGYRSAALDDLEPGALYLLRGPRRVGKTVTVKQKIQELLQAGVPPLSVVRVATDGWSSDDLRTVIQNIPLPPLAAGQRRYWFFDEITGVIGDWATQIKWLRDNDADFAEATVVLTGSSAAGLTRGAGVLAGRRGHADRTDRTVMPMGFRAFAGLWQPELHELPRLRLDQVHSQAGAAAYQLADFWLDTLVQLWEVYLRVGGFPASVAAAKAQKPVPSSFVDALFDVMHRDAFASSALDERQTSALAARVWQSTSTPLNQRSVGAAVGVANHTVARHLEYLRDSYLLWECPLLERPWIAKDRSQPKVYPVDPLIGRLAHLRNPNRDDLDPTVVAEAQVGMALRRNRMTDGEPWGADADLFYVRTPTRKEIDYVSEALDGAAVEGKYTDGGTWRREAATVEASVYRGLLATRSVLDTRADGAWAVPAAVLAVLVDS